MILVYEPFSVEYEHIPVNSQFLEIIRDTFEGEEIHFYGEKEHLRHIRKEIGKEGIVFHAVKIVTAEQKVKALKNEYKNIKRLYQKYKNQIRYFVVLNSHPHTMLLTKKVFQHEKIIFIVHGSLEELLHRKHCYQLGYYNRPAFRYRNDADRIRYIVLGESIRKNAVRLLPFVEKNMVSVPHPYQLDKNDYEKVEDGSEQGKIRIGTVGTGCKAKGSHLLYEVEEYLRRNHIENVELCHIGSYLDVCIPNNTSVKVIGGREKKLDTEEYNRKIEELDYILFFFDRESYKLTASGALCDAIVHKKPVIAIKNDYFSWVFQEVGEIGFLCESAGEIAECIQKIAAGDWKADQKMQKNLEYAQFFFSKEHVKKIMLDKKIWL